MSPSTLEYSRKKQSTRLAITPEPFSFIVPKGNYNKSQPTAPFYLQWHLWNNHELLMLLWQKMLCSLLLSQPPELPYTIDAFMVENIIYSYHFIPRIYLNSYYINLPLSTQLLTDHQPTSPICISYAHCNWLIVTLHSTDEYVSLNILRSLLNFFSWSQSLRMCWTNNWTKSWAKNWKKELEKERILLASAYLCSDWFGGAGKLGKHKNEWTLQH